MARLLHAEYTWLNRIFGTVDAEHAIYFGLLNHSSSGSARSADLSAVAPPDLPSFLTNLKVVVSELPTPHYPSANDHSVRCICPKSSQRVVADSEVSIS